MIVVSDTSPLTALLRIGAADLLPKLFSVVVIPEAVKRELQRTHADLPSWLRVEPVRHSELVHRYLQTVDVGEAEAIALATELHADRLLIDERKGRRLAAEEGVPVIGLLGVTLLAKRRALIPSARVFLDRLDKEAGIYLAQAVREAALKTVRE